MSRPRKLTERGRELLERNLRGKCASDLRAANAAGKLLTPFIVVDCDTNQIDVELFYVHYDKFVVCISKARESHERYTDAFAGDLSVLADFNAWFHKIFLPLDKLRKSAEMMSDNIKISDDVQPEDSASGVNVNMSSTLSKSNKSQSKTRSNASRSTVSSAQMKTRLRKAELMAEGKALTLRRELKRKQFELEMDLEELDLSTKLEVATAKQDILMEFGSEISERSSTILSISNNELKGHPSVGLRGISDLRPPAVSPLLTVSSPSVSTCRDFEPLAVSPSANVDCPSVSAHRDGETRPLAVGLLASDACPSVSVPVDLDVKPPVVRSSASVGSPFVGAFEYVGARPLAVGPLASNVCPSVSARGDLDARPPAVSSSVSVGSPFVGAFDYVDARPLAVSSSASVARPSVGVHRDFHERPLAVGLSVTVGATGYLSALPLAASPPVTVTAPFATPRVGEYHSNEKRPLALSRSVNVAAPLVCPSASPHTSPTVDTYIRQPDVGFAAVSGADTFADPLVRPSVYRPVDAYTGQGDMKPHVFCSSVGTAGSFANKAVDAFAKPQRQGVGPSRGGLSDREYVPVHEDLGSHEVHPFAATYAGHSVGVPFGSAPLMSEYVRSPVSVSQHGTPAGFAEERCRVTPDSPFVVPSVGEYAGLSVGQTVGMLANSAHSGAGDISSRAVKFGPVEGAPYEFRGGTNATFGVHDDATVPSYFNTLISKLTDVLTDQRNRLPEVSISKFGGDPLEFDSFVRAFESRIASRTADDGERLYYLEQYTFGTARDIVRSCMLMPSSMGYAEACRRLGCRFGDKFLLAHAYLKRLESWPTIINDDGKKLEEFTTFLVSCLNAMALNDGIRELDFPSSLRLVVSKLPSYLQDRWVRVADSIVHNDRRAVTFRSLVSFLEREVRVKANPLFGKLAMKGCEGNKSQQPKKRVISAATTTSAASEVSDGANRNKVIDADAFQSPCLLCQFPHSLSRCRKLKKMAHKDKLSVLRKHRLCFLCLSNRHLLPDCSKEVSCNVCHQAHHSILHKEFTDSNRSRSRGGQRQPASSVSDMHTPSDSTPVTSAFISRDVRNMPIVPVKLKLSSSDVEVSTHAFLDSGSSDTLITESLINQLGVSGRKTTILVTTLNASKVPQPSCEISNLEVCGINEGRYVQLPKVFTQKSLPVAQDQIPRQEDIARWPHLSHLLLPYLDAEVGLLIGTNVPKATEPWEVINSVDDGPYAVRTLLGWSINGPLRGCSDDDHEIPTVSSHRLHVDTANTVLDDQLRRFFNLDFSERHAFSDSKGLSVEDKIFLEIVEKQATLKDGHYEICLPLRTSAIPLPNNKSLAVQRLRGLKKKFVASDTFKGRYCKFIEDLFVKGHASVVPDDEILRVDGKLWYLPHHGVFHPRKDKLRVVLDASAKYAGTSLNDKLLSGPDLSSTLFGVLCRFRQERVAFMADLECMFYQVKVPPSQRDLLRFLWWPDGDVQKEIIECRMHAHIFGATSSPAVAKFALRKTALDNADSFSVEAVETMKRSFYVDDCLKSVPLLESAITLASELRALSQKGGFRLTQWVSNSRLLLNSIPESELAKNVKAVDLARDELPSEKALGVFWSVESDSLGFRISVIDKPATRRGILSIVSSVYDPLGMAAPFVLIGKSIIQELCRLKLGWDEDIPEHIKSQWQRWLDELPSLNGFCVARCYRPNEFGDLVSAVLHNFGDASGTGYGCVTFLRMEDDVGRVHCAFVCAKARVAPLKQMTIPRMELASAVLAVRMDRQLQNELDLPLDDSFFWSDSTSVLGYISNEQSRFHTFVANRVEVIRENSTPSQWRYVPTHLNPADIASRGLNGADLIECDMWRNGPSFLWLPMEQWPVQPKAYDVDSEDPEVKVVNSASISLKQTSEADVFSRIVSRFSDWYRLKRFVALCRRAVLGLRHAKSGQAGPDPRTVPLSSFDLDRAELVLSRWAQKTSYPEEVSLRTSDRLPKSSKLAPLNPIMIDGLLRVGGRIDNAPVSDDIKHQIIVPPDSPIAELLIRDIHRKIGHGGRDQVLCRLRQKFWIVHGNTLTRKILKACVFCRRKFGRPLTQKMADLPADRVSPDNPPFTNVGVDYFGPFLVKRGRSTVKRYGAIFTCLVSRAIHLEMAESLDTDAFINALRRFISRRGQIKIMRSDNGTNFVGANRELKEALARWNSHQIESFLLQKGITWIYNAPGASHHGGSWERLIRSVRRVLLGTMSQQVLTDDSLSTLLAEVESILNGRPLTRTTSDPDDYSCLTPNHLLLLKDEQRLPPGIFSKDDNYVRRRWRQVQYLSDLFWKRWTQQYLPLLQERQKWLFPGRNVQVDDIVLVVDPNAPRGSWLLGKVDAVYPDKKGLIRTVSVKTKSSTFLRPVSKLVLVLECD